MKRAYSWGVVLLLTGFLTACSTTPEPVPGGEGGGGMGGGGMGGDGGGMHRPSGETFGLSGPGAAEALTENGYRIHFELNSDIIGPEYEALLSQNAGWLRENAPVTVMVEGHCDERGTREFNLALGQKRADAVKRYLVSQGVDAGRVQTVTFGKEKPVTDGHDEFAWAKNRRGEIIIKR